ncbi:phage antirepressor KilAC domain-containing protein [Mobilitalea sibirica]|uniref:Phage antirepressor KilAC domain-containing protein n=1 Tax=Mobilitalea sibirica TaxID=1462919 RepID=A0A8J7L056_9FIRM|nr:phage antirepressor KilAC domain-containing protein [Mobilitalea sibirica]MBH1941673.1 phage antirepressor KilAC domain-containing protein [Mobilitalea sibirica]
MTELRIFKNEEFGEIRTQVINGNPWLVGKDVADVLGYANTNDALIRHVDKEDRANLVIYDGRQERTMVGVNESGLYALIFGSKLEAAKKFKHWVTSEVLPSIRQNGGYIANQENLTDSELLAKAVVLANNVIAQKDKQIAEQKPKVLFADAVSSSRTSILVGELAKLLRQNGVDIGGIRLFEWLRDNGYLIKRKGTDWNMPTQYSMDLELFEIKESTHLDGNGCNITKKTPKVTGKGQQYFINKFLGE